LEQYFEPVFLNIGLNYINTSSVKCLLGLIAKVGTLAKNAVKVSRIHEIDDNDMVAVGADNERPFTPVEGHPKPVSSARIHELV
jgi:hypothetical protein